MLLVTPLCFLLWHVKMTLWLVFPSISYSVKILAEQRVGLKLHKHEYIHLIQLL